MVSVVIASAMLIGMSIGVITLVSSNITNPISYSSSCDIQNIEIFQITDSKSIIEFYLYNTGDYSIESYEIIINDYTKYVDDALSPREKRLQLIEMDSINVSQIIISIKTINGNSFCMKEI